jgi:hypothetical protein
MFLFLSNLKSYIYKILMTKVTVVTCYYTFPSKHSIEEYDLWMNNFLQNFNCNLVIFTSPDLEQYIEQKREKFKNNTKIIIEPIDTNEIYLKYKNDWDYQYYIDNQKNTGRSKNCYIIWNSKLNYLKKVIELNPFQTDKFVWTDIGCLRNSNSLLIEKIKNFPKYEKVSQGKLDIVLLESFKNSSQEYFQDEIHFAGAMFGSDKETILKVHKIFYEKLQKFIENKKFIGCDQQTFSSIYLTNKELFNPIIPTNSFVDVWFYLWQYYS